MKDSYSITTQRKVIEKFACVYIHEIYENKDTIKIEIDDFIGTIKEERTHYNFVQTSYVYIAHVIEDTKHLNFTEKEKAEGSCLLWLYVDDAIEKIKNCESEKDYFTKFVVRRDYNILEYYKNYKVI